MGKYAGKFIVLDGPDGAGKSTQIRLLANHLESRGESVCELRDPGGTSIGDQIRAILLDNANTAMAVNTEVLLYMASRAQLYAEKIIPALNAGQCVLCDRWLSSTLTYQAAAGKMGNDAVLQIAEAALERSWPDLTIIIDLPAETGMRRVGKNKDRMENKGESFHRDVRQAFLDLAATRPDIVTVTGNDEVEQVHRSIVQIMERPCP